MPGKGGHQQETKAMVELVLHRGTPLVERGLIKARTKAMGTERSGSNGEQQQQGTGPDQRSNDRE